jgi:hypothetical protein
MFGVERGGMLMSLEDTPDFLGRKVSKPRLSRRFVRGLSTVFVGFLLFAFGLMGWFVYDQSTWNEAEGTVVQRIVGRRGTDLVVAFDTSEGNSANERVREWTVRNVGDVVRIRYGLNSSGEVRNSRLAEEPIGRAEFFVMAGVMLVVGLGVLYWAWWRMPPDDDR